MDDTRTQLSRLDVDEAWLVEWAAEGLAAFERLLASHAAFADYLRTRNLDDPLDGDRSPDV